MTPDDYCDLAILATSTAYAAWLKRHKEHEPHRTWIEVAVGVGYTLVFSAVALRLTPRDGRATERRIRRSFVLSSMPIIAGEVEQELTARAEWRRYTARVQEFVE